MSGTKSFVGDVTLETGIIALNFKHIHLQFRVTTDEIVVVEMKQKPGNSVMMIRRNEGEAMVAC